MTLTQIMVMIEAGGNILGKMKEIMDKSYGFIHKRSPAVIDGKSGFLVWDYIVWNEITFEDDKGKMYSFFTSVSDNETEQVWNELMEKYGA